MVYGLYDIDLQHQRKSPPNLDLMKIYAYLTAQNKKVIMMKPKMDEGRFGKIIYFKETPHRIPQSLHLRGDNKILRGAGFFGTYTPLKPEIEACAPDLSPYDAYSHKVQCDSYDKLKKNSIVRFSPEDFTGFKPEAKAIYVIDRDPLSNKNLTDYFSQYSDKTFYFLNAIKVKNKQEIEDIKTIVPLCNSRFYLDFNFDAETMVDFAQINRRKCVISGEKKTGETDGEYTLRLIKMGLAFKHYNVKPNIGQYKDQDELDVLVAQWIKSCEPISFYEYYKKDFSVLALMYNHPYREWLKTDPASLDTKTLDFWHNV